MHQKDQKVIHMQNRLLYTTAACLVVVVKKKLLVEQKGFHVTTNEWNKLIKAKNRPHKQKPYFVGLISCFLYATTHTDMIIKQIIGLLGKLMQTIFTPNV